MVMDRAGWLWRRKSSDKSPGGSDSSMSVSSHSEQCSDDQGQSPETSSRNRYDYSQETGAARSLSCKLAAGVNLKDSSPENGQSVEQHVSSNVKDEETKEIVRSLNEKLSAALLTIRAKEDLVKQHAKVTEEAVAGWEQAEAEVTALKGLLEASCQKNASLQDQVSHLDEALKECVRQLRLAREEQEDKIREIFSKKSQVPQSENRELQNHITELKKRLEVTRSEASSSMLLQHDLQEKLQAIEKENLNLKAKLHAIEKENMDLKAKLLVQSKDLKILMLERDLSNQAAETASKQHLESVKKIARVEAECRRLQHLTRQTALINDSRPTQNNGCMESLTDSQSDHGEHMVAVDNDLQNTDSWASALIAELDQFKNGKDGSRNLVNNPVEIDIMDDFLEMERLAALPESDRTSSNFEMETDSDKAVARSISLKVETEELQNQVTDLQEKFDAIESEKKELEMALMEARNQLDISCDALVAAKNRLVEMQVQLDSANNSKLAALEDVERLDSERKALELQLESKSAEVDELLMAVTSLEENAGQKELESQLELMSAQATELSLTVASLEERIQAERALSVQHKEKEEATLKAKEELEAQLCSANTEMGKLLDIVKALENEVKTEKALHEELMAQVQVKMEAAVDAVKESLEAQLCSANNKAGKLRDVVKELENEVEKEKALHEELTAQLQVKMEAAIDAVKESLKAQLCSANTEAGKLRDVVKELENEVEKEKALHEELAAQMEVKTEVARTAEAVKESLEAKLCSANAEIQKLQDNGKALQSELENEKALYEELKAQLEMKIEAERTCSVESARESLEEQLQLVNLEAANLRDMVTALEHDVEKEKVFSAELQMQLEALEAVKKVLESEAESAIQEARNLNQKVESLEAKLEEQMSSAEEITTKAEALQSERMAMEHKLKTADRELIKLTNKVSLLHREIEQERLLSEEYEQKCQKLEAQLSRDSRDAKLWRLANSNGDLKVKKEKELANAAGRLAECQKTIASLEHQLKSLTDLDSVVLEPERLESSREMPLPLDFRNSNAEFSMFADDFRNGDAEFTMFADELYNFELPNSNTSCFSPLPSIQPSSPPSEMSVFAGGLSTLSSYRSKRASRR